jgi:hypothetical protein
MRTVLAGTVLLMVGCSPTYYTVVKLAPTNPMAQTTNYYVANVDFEGIQVEGKPEADWLAKRNEKQRSSWENDKAVYTKELLNEFWGKGYAMISKGRTYRAVEGAPSDGMVVHVHIGSLGDDTLFVVKIDTPAGENLDEFRISGHMSFWGFAPMLANTRAMLAERIDRYLRDRAAGKVELKPN